MSGRGWAYFGVILGFFASITANIASTILKETEVSLWLRVPFAIFWPLATYVAIEVLVRTDWQARLSHRAVKVVIWGPVGIVAAFVSYLHQHHLMLLAGEPGLAQGFGPLAVDGMLFGMTATLIVTRVKERAPETAEMETVEKDLPVPVEEMQEEETIPVSPAPVFTPEPIPSPLPIPVSAPPMERSPRAPRSSWDAEKVVSMLLAGEKNSIIVDATGIGTSTLPRYRRVVNILREDRNATVDKSEKVPAAHVQMIRELVTK